MYIQTYMYTSRLAMEGNNFPARAFSAQSPALEKTGGRFNLRWVTSVAVPWPIPPPTFNPVKGYNLKLCVLKVPIRYEYT